MGPAPPTPGCVIPGADALHKLTYDEVHHATIAENGERALKAAIVMLAELDALENGDRLTVTEGSP